METRRDIARDYANGSEGLGDFFQHDFRCPPDPALAEAVATQPDRALIDEIRDYNALLGADERSLHSIDALRRPETVAVVTGQQAGIFTGPLYTIYKALTAVRLSERYGAVLQRQVVPIFWVASDDHDFDEIRAMQFVDWRGRVQSLTYVPTEAIAGLPVSCIPAERERLRELVRTLDEETADSERKEEVIDFLNETLRDGESLADWFGRLLMRLFRGTGLIIFFPHKHRARELAAEVIAQEVRSPGTTSALLNQTSSKLAALGYSVQVEKKPNEAHFFLHTNGKRRKVLFERDRYYVPDEDISYSVAEMAQTCSSEPERFSPNVVLRPVVQGAILPTLEYVAGPGEIAYWAQLRPIFERFGVPMVRIFPRPHLILINGRCAKLLRKREIHPEQLSTGDDTILGRPAGDPASSGEKPILRETSQRVLSELERYVREISKVDASLGASAAKLKRKIEYELRKLSEKARAARDQRTQRGQNEADELRANLFPSGKPQERVLNIFPYVIEAGWTLIPTLLGEVEVDRTGYQPIII